MHAATIELLQRACQAEGYYAGKIDSLRGPLTDAAVSKLMDAWEAVPPVVVVPSADDDWRSCEASSFADPADLRAFDRCKATGKTDLQCFAVGDNGIGQWGAKTAQEHTPMVAIHKTDLVARWGSVDAGAHRRVEIECKGRMVTAAVEDRISAPGRIDLNPATAKALGLRPPFVVPVRWRWVV